MRTDDFFDLLGEIDDKYYMETMCEEPETVAPVAAGKIRFSFLRAAASLAAVIGIAAGGILLHNSGLLTSRGQENVTEQTGPDIGDSTDITGENANTPLYDLTVTDLNRAVSHSVELIKPTEEQIRESVDYILENQNNSENNIAGNVYGILTAEDLSCYTIDLNFDNTEEIVVVSWDYSDLFIFELNGESAVFNSTVAKNNIDFIITEDNFIRLAPHYGDDVTDKDNPTDGECYYYFYYEPETDFEEMHITAAAVKYDRETGKYRAEMLMEYGAKNEDGNFENHFGVSPVFSSAEGEMTEEEFSELWYGYEKLPPLVFAGDIDYCKNYVVENYDDLISLTGYFSDVTLEELSYYVKDLNFDGAKEIIIVSWEHSPLFVFEHKPDGFSFNSLIGYDKIRSYLNEESFSTLAAYDDGEEKYMYYYYETDYGLYDISRNVSAIKYNSELGYYTEYLLSYGLKSDDGSNLEAFFRRYTNLAPPSPRTESLDYEEFVRLWNKHGNLPPVSFVDINDKIFRLRESERHRFVFDFDAYGYDFHSVGGSYIIDENGNITDMDGNAEWDANGDLIAFAVSELAGGNLEYMGEIEQCHYGDIVSITQGKAYHYTDHKMHNTYLLIIWNPDPYKTDVFATAMLKRCSGYDEIYPDFDVNKIPDVHGLSEYQNNRFNEEAEALYAAMYPCYSHAVLYSEEKYGYRFELTAERIFKDVSVKDTIFMHGSAYTRITKIDDENAMTVFDGCPLLGRDSIPVQESYEEYAQRVYELKDGIVMFCPCTDTGGTLTPFTTIIENEDGSIEIGYLYGNFGELMIDMSDWWRQLDIEARFTADYENNTLYYGDTGFVFDFSKVGMGFDEETGGFVPCFETVKAAG